MNFSIPAKLFILSAIPILLAFAAIYENLRNEYDNYVRLVDLDHFGEFNREAGELFKNLHLEYTLGNAYLKTQAGADTEKLDHLYAQTDRMLAHFVDGHLDVASNLNIAALKSALKRLPYLRANVKRRTLDPGTLYTDYTELIGILLDIMESYPMHSNDPAATRLSQALKELIILEEKAHLERALLTDIFSCHSISEEEYLDFIAGTGSQSHHLQVLTSQLDKEKGLPVEALFDNHNGYNHYKTQIKNLYTKQRYLAELKAYIGYGGLVHDFKNFLLRNEGAYYDHFLATYAAFTRTLNRYQILAANNQKEYTDLLIIADVFENYRKQLDTIKAMHRAGKTHAQIDAAVRISDYPAIEAFASLPEHALSAAPHQWYTASTQRINSFEALHAALYARLHQRIAQVQYESQRFFVQNVLLNFFILLLLIVGITWMAHRLVRDIKTLQSGLLDFFDYLNFKAEDPAPITVRSNDELGEMAEVINEQIEITRDRLTQDDVFIYEATEVVTKMKEGDFDVKVHFKPKHPALQRLNLVMGELIALIQAKIKEQTLELEKANASLSEKVLEQTRALQENLQELSQFKLAINQSLMTCSVSTEGVIFQANQAFRETLGFKNGALNERPIRDLLPLAHRSEIESEIFPVISTGKIYSGVQPLRRYDGGTCYADMTITPLSGSDGEVKEYICLFNDITPIIEARDKAIAAEKSKDEFLSNMSHEIRTPLNAILGFVGIVSKRVKDKKTLYYLDIIDNSGKSLLAIINDILDFAKIQSGKFHIAPHPFEPVEEFSNTAMLFASKAYEKSLNYLVYIDPNLPECVEADLVRIKQVISNLLSNAIKFTPEEGSIKVRITHIGERFNITVQDSGIGIPEEHQTRIFNAFEQADGSTTRQFGGTGLGLSISNKLAELLHGSLRVRSRPGQGSIFDFSVPYATCSALKRIEHHYDKIRSLRIGILPASANDAPVMQLLRRYLKDFGITNVQEITDIESDHTDLIVFIPDEANIADVIASKHPAIALEKSPDARLNEHSHIYPLHAPFVPTSVMEALDDATIKRLRGVKEPEKREVPQFNGDVLVVEDNATNQMLITLLLDDYGLDYAVANDGLEAVEKARERRFDLILMDENMPNLNGTEAMKQIKAYQLNEAQEPTPIVALTANVMQGDRERFIEAGMDSFIAKPIENSELEAVLKRFVAMRA